MIDLRERVKEDRGLLKNIELAIPGFRGYRKKEDLRIADSLLRNQLANELKIQIVTPLERARLDISKSLELELLREVGPLLHNLRTLENRIRHAEQGYSGISPHYQISDEQLNVLYDYDWSLIKKVESIRLLAKKIMENAQNNNFTDIHHQCAEMRTCLEDFTGIFDKRIATIADLEAFT